jgi:hypothetical protein
MEVGQVSNINALQEVLHRQAYMPIHKYLAHLIPYLEHRQEVAKRFYKNKGKNQEYDEQANKIIEWNNVEVMKILDITIPPTK